MVGFAALTPPYNLGELVFSQFISAITAKPAPLANIEKLVARSGNELKSFYVGNEYVYQRGYEAVHARGLLFGFVGCIVVMALMNSNNKAS